MFTELEKASNLEALKKTYRKLALQYHPDQYGDDGTAFIKLQEAFEKMHETLKGIDKDSWRHKDSASDFMSVINAIMDYNINIEIVGSWIWVNGTGTYEIKEELKNLKFWWSSKHKTWIYSGQAGKTKRRATKINPKEHYNVEQVKSQKLLAV